MVSDGSSDEAPGMQMVENPKPHAASQRKIPEPVQVDQSSSQAYGDEPRSPKSSTASKAHGDDACSQKSSNKPPGDEPCSQKSSNPKAPGDDPCSQKSSNPKAPGDDPCSQKSSTERVEVSDHKEEQKQWSRSKAIKEFFRAHEGIDPDNATSIRGFDRLDHTAIFPPPGTPLPEEVIVQKMADLHMQGPSVVGPGQKRSRPAAGTSSVQTEPATAHTAKKARYVDAGDVIVCQGQTLKVMVSTDGTCVLQPYEAGY